jgi:hypothetical protein
METTGATETLVRIYQTTRRHIPENSDLHCYWHKNVKFLLKIVYRILFERFKLVFTTRLCFENVEAILYPIYFYFNDPGLL